MYVLGAKAVTQGFILRSRSYWYGFIEIAKMSNKGTLGTFFSPHFLHTLEDIQDQHTPVWLISIVLNPPLLKIMKRFIDY